jgi:hypothetical protein
MYQSYPAWITAFHGCDQSVFEKVLYSHTCLTMSNNDYDWLGHGIYFWEHNPVRAYEFALEQKSRGKISRPAVIGAMINLGNCLDMTDKFSMSLLKRTYSFKCHIQLCIINLDCIKGFFAPRIDVKSQYEATLAH